LAGRSRLLGGVVWTVLLTGYVLGDSSLSHALAQRPGQSQGAQDLYRVQVGALILEAPLSERGQVDSLAAFAERMLPALERDLGVVAVAPFRVVLLPPGELLNAELRRLDAAAPSWAAGFMIGYFRVGAIRLGQAHRYPYDGAPEVLAHEITHLLLWDATRGALPTWFGEGVATFEGRRRGMRDFLAASAAVLAHELPAIRDLDSEFEASPSRARRAYAVSVAFVSWSVGRYGADLVPELLDRAPEHGFEEAWRIVTGESLPASERSWRRRMLWIHRWAPVLFSSATAWLGISVLAIVAGVVKRRRRRELWARWEEEERRAAVLAGSSWVTSEEPETPPDDEETVH
jgi:hypothetical protein